MKGEESLSFGEENLSFRTACDTHSWERGMGRLEGEYLSRSHSRPHTDGAPEAWRVRTGGAENHCRSSLACRRQYCAATKSPGSGERGLGLSPRTVTC